ncbi:DUF3943 domain-containing protein [Marinospirillum alkaliphilum]|uniref:DUF3943 domain-containing protein n=1 Tax=Marinospirillum alkaliphilum TaxID=148454 RepID=UPI0009306DCE|nr:DUF3943 domain-containing protein [Marinospirillum alkaliphilum]
MPTLALANISNAHPHTETSANLICHSLACQHLAQLYTPAFAALQQESEPSTQTEMSKSRRMIRETRNIGIMSLGIMAVLFVMPENISKWDRSEMTFSNLGDKWIENNKAGPVWDQDEWPVNYIGHPYFGAAYYVVARNQGLTPLESGAYSFAMSTFLWEMGIEALAEIPSKQDLIVTPLIGSVVGEAFFTWEQRIKANQNELMGSRALGNTTLFLLNPAGSLSARINRAFGDDEPVTGAYTQLVYSPAYQRFEPGSGYTAEPSWVGVKVGFLF